MVLGGEWLMDYVQDGRVCTHTQVRSSLDILTWLTWITPQVVIGGRGGKCVSAHT